MDTLPTPDSTTVLQRSSPLRIEIDSHIELTVQARGGTVRCRNHALTILKAFAQPAPFGEAVAALSKSVSGAQEWIDLTHTIRSLYNVGALVDCNAPDRDQQDKTWAFDDPLMHVRMLNDRTRTSSFIAALRGVIVPGEDVVVDLGTGSGVLAVAAARAGARHVYAVEVGHVADVAEEIFTANDVADRITLVRGWSSQLTLPERADVLVSETIGDHPLGEQILESVLDARKRLLKPGARLVPRSLDLYGLPVHVPERVLEGQTIGARLLSQWEDWYGIDFSPIQRFVSAGGQRSLRVRAQQIASWPRLSEPVLLTHLDFHTFVNTKIDVVSTFEAAERGILNGILVYFDLCLSETETLSTHPNSLGDGHHWFGHVWLAVSPLDVAPGDLLSVRYRYRVPGYPDGVEVERSASGMAPPTVLH